MGRKGDIILVRFPFTDTNQFKIQPALVLTVGNTNHVCVAFISSSIPPRLVASDILLNVSDQNFPLTGLKTKSAIRLRKIATVDTARILGKIGNVHNTILNQVDEKLKMIFDLN